jgi:hypothetical protein
VLFKRKKDGTLRCVWTIGGYTKSIIKNKFPLPHIYDLFDYFCITQIFSKIDLHNGYHQIQVKELDV